MRASINTTEGINRPKTYFQR